MVILNCLQYLATHTNESLSREDLAVLQSRRVLMHPAFVDVIKELKPLFDKATHLDKRVWQRAGEALLAKDAAKGLWCYSNALLRTEPGAQRQNIFRLLCKRHIKDGDIDALKQLLKSGNYVKEIGGWGESNSIEADTWLTLLVANYEVGGALSLSERAQVFAHYAQASPPEIKADLFHGLETVAVLKEKGLVTPQTLSACKDLLSPNAYLDVVFEKYIDTSDPAARLPYLLMLENAVDGQPNLQNALKSLCLRDGTRKDENLFLQDVARAGKHAFLLKVFPVELYSATLLKLARDLFSSGSEFNEVFLWELISACYICKRMDVDNPDVATDAEPLKLAKKYLIKTAQIDKCAKMGVSIDTLLYAKRLQHLAGGTLADGEVAIPEKEILFDIFYKAGGDLTPAARATLFAYKLQSDPSEFLDELYEVDTVRELQKQGLISLIILAACHKRRPLEDSNLVAVLISDAFASENQIALINLFNQKTAVRHFQHYFNNHTVSDEHLTSLAASLWTLQFDDTFAALADDHYMMGVARFLAKRVLYRLMGANTVPPELRSLTAKLCLLGECEDILIQAFYPDWDPEKQLPAVIVDVLKSQQSLSVPEVMGLVGTMDIDNSVRRNGYAAALLETRLLGHDGRHIIRAASAEEVSKKLTCDGCEDEFSEKDSVFKLDEECGGVLCKDCVGISISNLKNANQCQWDCSCKIHSNTGIALGADFDTVLAMRQATVMSHFATNKDWYNCEDSDCIGGRPHVGELGGAVDARSTRRSVRHFSPATARSFASEGGKQVEEAGCMLCHKVSVAKTEVDVKAEIDSVKMLLQYLGEVSSKREDASGRLRQYENGEGIIRECFGCGKSVEKDEACAQVTCHSDCGHNGARGCGTTFDIIAGSRSPNPYFEHRFFAADKILAQEYIPGRQSVLWKVGFYSKNKGCTPSTRNPELMRQLIKDKRKWFKAYSEKALADLEMQKAKAQEKPQSTMLLGSFKYPNHQQTSQKDFIRALVTGDLVSYQGKGAWYVGTVKKVSEQAGCLTVIERDGKPRDYSIDTRMIQPLGLVPMMPQKFLPREPIEYRVSASQAGVMSYSGSGGSDWRLGIVEKSNDDGVWIKVTEGQPAEWFPHGENRLASAGTHHCP